MVAGGSFEPGTLAGCSWRLLVLVILLLGCLLLSLSPVIPIDWLSGRQSVAVDSSPPPSSFELTGRRSQPEWTRREFDEVGKEAREEEEEDDEASSFRSARANRREDAQVASNKRPRRQLLLLAAAADNYDNDDHHLSEAEAAAGKFRELSGAMTSK